MPIDYSKYPPDWPERRARILERAGHKCEQCGVPDRTWRCVNPDTWDGDLEFTQWSKHLADGFVAFLRETYPEKNIPKPVFIVLTIAHLDHDAENWEVEDDRLAALCQRCHLRYDAPERARKYRVRKYRDSLFPFQGEG